MVVTTHQAKTQLSKLIQRALAGEEIIIAKRDKPLVRLQVIEEEKPKRRAGSLKGLIISMGDNFDDEIDDFDDCEIFPEDLPEVAEDPAEYKTKNDGCA